MKKIITLLLSLLAILACTPDAVPGHSADIPVQSVELYVSTLSMIPGDKAELSAKVTPANATDKALVWTSSDKEVAAIGQNGHVMAIGEGRCTVSVSCGGKSAVCEVTVSLPVVPVTSVTLDKETACLLTGETLQLSATILPENATHKEVTWTSSNTDVAKVEDGLVTALTPGDATITATAGEFSATCAVNVRARFSYGGMCLEAVSKGQIIISNPLQLTIDYKVEELDWVSVRDEMIYISAKAGERVWFRGQNETYAVENEDLSVTRTNIQCRESDFYLYGNLMSLVCGDEFGTVTQLSGENTFRYLFYKNNYIINHPSLDIELPAMTLSPHCYQNMFHYCSKLTRAPKLPARILTDGCYASMFSNCSSLKEFPKMDATEMSYMCCTWMMKGTGIEEAPELPAMNLARSCYEFMFEECPNLKKAMTVLPATELAIYCYKGMFMGSEKLETAPELPAQEMKYSCYSNMFSGCKALRKAPELPALTLANACYQLMFKNSGLLEAPVLPAMNLEDFCYQHMFENCVALKQGPNLPATELAYSCYRDMFKGCSSLSYIKADFLTTPNNYYYYTTDWVDGVAAEGTFVKNPDAKWDVRGTNGVPEGWKVLTTEGD